MSMKKVPRGSRKVSNAVYSVICCSLLHLESSQHRKAILILSKWPPCSHNVSRYEGRKILYIVEGDYNQTKLNGNLNKLRICRLQRSLILDFMISFGLQQQQQKK